MGLERLDLWQIHDIRTREDIEEVEAPGGALEAFVEARDAGMVRFIGVTGHHAPKILEYAVRNWPVDSVLMPVNPAEAVLGGFLDRVMAAAKDRGLAVIGMKTLGASQLHLRPGWSDGRASPQICPFPRYQHSNRGLLQSGRSKGCWRELDASLSR